MDFNILDKSWSISQKGYEKITDNDKIKDKLKILKNALDSDLKEIGKGLLTKDNNKFNLQNIVLQIQKIRNIAAPKANENSQIAPRMLKLILTDGENYIQAIEVTPISLNSDRTPPGTKLLIINAQIQSGFLLLNSNNFKVLGGIVTHLYEKWEFSKTILFSQNRHNNASGDGGPPPWVNFGQKIKGFDENDEFKSLDTNKNNKEISEFDLQRKEAIAEVSSGAIKKTFGGTIKQTIQPSPSTNRRPINNGNLKNKNQKNKKGTIDTDIEDLPPQKPSEKVSLFDFVGDKLPIVNNEITSQSRAINYQKHNNQQYNDNKYHYENNRKYYSSSSVYYITGASPADLYKKYGNLSKDTQTPNKNIKQSTNVTFPIKNYRKDNDESEYYIKGASPADLYKKYGNLSMDIQKPNKNIKQSTNVTCNNTYNIGDKCLAKYWEDGKFYNATIKAITDKTYVVKFKDYGNVEEIIKEDCMPCNSTTPNNSNNFTQDYRKLHQKKTE